MQRLLESVPSGVCDQSRLAKRFVGAQAYFVGVCPSSLPDGWRFVSRSESLQLFPTGEIPTAGEDAGVASFLHVSEGNMGARRLYQSMGFAVRASLGMCKVERIWPLTLHAHPTLH